MAQPIFKKTALALLLAFSCSLPALAADDEAAKVAEIIDLSAKAPYEKMMSILSDRIQSGFLLGLAQAMRQNPVAPEHQAQAQQIIEKHSKDFAARLKAHLDKSVPWDALASDVYAPLYLKHFTPAETDALLAFYRSDTGKKFVETVPVLMQEATQAVNEKYGAVLGSFAPTLLQEKTVQIFAELKPLLATPPLPAPEVNAAAAPETRIETKPETK